MSLNKPDDFIPLNQSTPIQGGWQRRNNSDYYNNSQNGHKRHSNGHNSRWSNNSKRNNITFGSDRSGGSQRQCEADIGAYLHPGMMQDPWAHLRKTK